MIQSPTFSIDEIKNSNSSEIIIKNNLTLKTGDIQYKFFNNGEGLIQLDPGKQYTASFGIHLMNSKCTIYKKIKLSLQGAK